MNGKELLKILKENGWEVTRIKGSHHQVRKGNKTFPVPVHGKKDIAKGTLHNILKLAKIKL
jgi:predicted RNA binding protein YcfA (HicA-like mRNA interferase family)